MSKRTYEFDILAKIDQAIAAVDQLTATTNKKLDKISFASFTSAGIDAFRLVKDAATSAFNTIEGLGKKAIDQAVEAEAAEIKLANALRITGDYSEQAVRSFDKLAASIAGTTTFSKQSVQGSVAIAKQFQLTNKETERTIAVAADLAAVTGDTLDNAVRKVAQTFNGFVDKDLAKTIPALKGLTLNAKVSGAAVEVIAARVKGSAEALGDNFSGAVFRASEALNDIFENIGKIITQNPAIIAGINALGAGFREFGKEIEKNGPAISVIVKDGFLAIINAAPRVVKALGQIVFGFNYVKAIIEKVGAILGAVAAALLNPFQGADIFSALSDDLDELDKKFYESAEASDKFFGGLEVQTKKIADNVTKAVNAAGNTKKKLPVIASNTGKDERLKNLDTPEIQKARIEAISKDPIQQAIKFAFSADLKFNQKDYYAAGAGIVNQILKGADGATKAIQGVVSGVADALLPGIGGVAGEIVGVLAQGPEEVKKQVKAFADALPGIITAVVQAIPALIEALIDAVPQLIKALIDALPELINGIIEALPRLFLKINELLPQIVISLITGIVENIPKIVEGFAKEFLKIPAEFAKALLDAINPTSSGGGGANGEGGGSNTLKRIGLGVITAGASEIIPGAVKLAKKVGGWFGLAEGGTITRSAPLQGDRLGGVNLGMNETVVDSELTDWFRQMKNSGQGMGGQMPDVVVKIGLQDFARISFNARKAGHQL